MESQNSEFINPDLDQVKNQNENEQLSTNDADVKETPSSDFLDLESIELPEGYLWVTVDLSNETQMKEVYELLKANYLEDDDAEFGFEYTPDIIKWAAKPPECIPEWICGAREEETNSLIGFISAIPMDVSVDDSNLQVAQVNLLCVRKDLRDLGFAPLLSYELQRRVQAEGITQMIYSSEKLIARAPEPVANCSSWFRVLNPEKCVEARYCLIKRDKTLEDAIKEKELPPECMDFVFRKIESHDKLQVQALLQKYLEKFKIHPIFTEKHFDHLFFSSPFVHVYVIEKDKQITDMVSFYDQELNVLNGTPVSRLKCANSMYIVAASTPIEKLMTNILANTKKEGYDLFMSMGIMDNMEFITPLKFEEMDCSLYYYVHDWECPKMFGKDIAVINL